MPVTIYGSGPVTGVTSITGTGMDLITPTSVVGATLSGGEISFSAASIVSINGCFTSTYDAYTIWAQFSSSVADITVGMRMRAAGTDASGANYDYQEFVAANTTLTGARSSSQTSGVFARCSDCFATINIHNPALSAITYYLSQAWYGPGVTITQYAGRHTPTTAYDGFTVLPSSGTITGKLRIYGSKKS